MPQTSANTALLLAPHVMSRLTQTEREYVPSPLPHPTNFSHHRYPNALRAYTVCHSEETKGSNQLVFVRVLGWMLEYATTSEMLDALSTAIVSCKEESDQLRELGKFYVDFWIRTFRKYKGVSTIAVNSVSRPSFNTVAEEIKARLVARPSNHSTAKENALIRDSFCCNLTKAYDQTAVRKNEEVRARYQNDGSGKQAATQCTHIVCGSANLDIEGNRRKTNYDDNAWAVLERLGYGELFEELKGNQIHRLSNILTLDTSSHELFDNFEIWFEPIENQPPESHRYKVGSTDDCIFRQIPREVEFADASGGQLDLPSRRYLGLHAVCAKVANLSGAADYLDKLDSDQQQESVLAFDGSSAAVLEHALRNAFWLTSHLNQLTAY